MADPKYFNALFREHGAEPARLLRPQQADVLVIVRGFLEEDEGVRLVIESRDEAVNQQLLVPRDGLRALVDRPSDP